MIAFPVSLMQCNIFGKLPSQLQRTSIRGEWFDEKYEKIDVYLSYEMDKILIKFSHTNTMKIVNRYVHSRTGIRRIWILNTIVMKYIVIAKSGQNFWFQTAIAEILFAENTRSTRSFHRRGMRLIGWNRKRKNLISRYSSSWFLAYKRVDDFFYLYGGQ